MAGHSRSKTLLTYAQGSVPAQGANGWTPGETGQGVSVDIVLSIEIPPEGGVLRAEMKTGYLGIDDNGDGVIGDWRFRPEVSYDGGATFTAFFTGGSNQMIFADGFDLPHVTGTVPPGFEGRGFHPENAYHDWGFSPDMPPGLATVVFRQNCVVSRPPPGSTIQFGRMQLTRSDASVELVRERTL